MLTRKRAWGAGLVWLACGLVAGCTPRRSARAEDALVEVQGSPALSRSLYEVLTALPERPGEPLVEFFYRVRAALMAEDDEMLRSLALKLPDHESAAITDEVRFAIPVIVARWARQVWTKERQMLLQQLVSRRTVNDPASPTPGRSPAFDAFERDLKAAVLGAGLSFAHVEHVAYEVGLEGRGAGREVAMVVHADVVPADHAEWDTPPFVLTDVDGRWFGRGVLDDKGPLVAGLTALVALQQSGLDLPLRPRLVVGTSEERAKVGIQRYQQARPLPADVFVADGDFPVGIGEKGVANVLVKAVAAAPASRKELDASRFQLVRLEGGEATNQVPPEAQAELILTPNAAGPAATASLEKAAEDRPDIDVAVDVLGERVFVRAHGKAAHAATPHEGKNAVGVLMAFLAAHGRLLPTPCTRLVRLLGTEVGAQPDAAPLGLDDTDARFSGSTVNLGTVQSGGGGVCEVALNLRWPPPRSADEAIEAVRQTLMRKGAEDTLEIAVEGDGQSPFVIEGRAPLVSALSAAYATVTGLPAAPTTVPFTTYAKAIGHGAVTFGPRSNDPARAAGLHASNEYVARAEFVRWIELYTYALVQLALEGLG